VSRSLNKVILIGNVGADPEIRSTGGGSRVAQVSLATSRQWTNQQGEKQEKTEWHRLVAWERKNAGGGDPFNVIERFVKKGEKLYVEGEIQYRSYEDKDGVTKYTTEIRGRELVMLGSGSSGGPGGGGGAPARREPSTVPERDKKKPDYDGFPTDFPEGDDDLPF
jgi:single-strand DNA-binding protein